jgi:thymidylate synthase
MSAPSGLAAKAPLMTLARLTPAASTGEAAAACREVRGSGDKSAGGEREAARSGDLTPRGGGLTGAPAAGGGPLFFSAIFARDQAGNFGRAGKADGKPGRLPWTCELDLAWFRKTTTGHTLVMGRRTWESLAVRPLPGRHHIVLSRNPSAIGLPAAGSLGSFGPRLLAAGSLAEALTLAASLPLLPPAAPRAAPGRAGSHPAKASEAAGAAASLTAGEAKAESIAPTSRAGTAGGPGSATRAGAPVTAARAGTLGAADIFVIGGAGLLKEAFADPSLERIILSEYRLVAGASPAHYGAGAGLLKFDAPLPAGFRLAFEEACPGAARAEGPDGQQTLDVCHQIWVRGRDTAEGAYLELLARVLAKGAPVMDRTGVGTIGMFGEMFRCDLRRGFPALTTKRLHWKSVVVELLWMLRGETNVAFLHKHGVGIWDANAASPAAAKLGLGPGELGPIYGAQWRSFGPNAAACPRRVDAGGGPTAASGSGCCCRAQAVDQIRWVVDQVRAEPHSRRLVVSAWNPMVLEQVALPSCHALFQFEVRSGRLSCLVYMRSNDLFLGAPFNLASYALLTHIVAEIAGLEVGELVYAVGSAHVYANHVDQVREQLARPARLLPRLVMDRAAVRAIYPSPRPLPLPPGPAAGGGRGPVETPTEAPAPAPASTIPRVGPASPVTHMAPASAVTHMAPASAAPGVGHGSTGPCGEEAAPQIAGASGPAFGHLVPEHFRLVDYWPHPAIAAPMAV